MKRYITATDVMNYLYDPRSIYLMHVLKIPQETTIKMKEGRNIHELYSDSSNRNKIVKELPKLDKEYDIYLESEQLQAATRIDCIIFDTARKRAYPLEFKYSRAPKKLYERQIYQLVLEAILIEEFYGYSVNFGYMKFLVDDKLKKISITKELKTNMVNILQKIRDIIEEERYPKIRGIHPRLKDFGYKNVL